MKKYLFYAFAAMACVACAKQQQMQSPNGLFEAEFVGDTLQVIQKVDGESLAVIPIALGNIDRIDSIVGPQMQEICYEMISGKKRHCQNQCNEYGVYAADSAGMPVVVRLRLCNDGVAFRYEFSDSSFAEQTAYVITEGQTRFNQKYVDCYEDFFPMSTTGEQENRRWGYPLLVQSPDSVWALITEAGIEKGHSASWLSNDADAQAYRVVAGESLPTAHPDHTPWRIVIAGDLADIVESTLVTDMSQPSTLDETDWIEPGSVSWIYWAYNHGSKDYQIVKQYIDMAAALHLPYVLIDAEWDEMSNGGDINDAIAYAKSQGVKPLIWYNSSTAWVNYGAPGPYYRLNDPEAREREMQWLEEVGVAGMKIDFFDGDKQAAMDYCIDLLESAAKHKLLVNFHGATLPRGWQRTYPHLLTTEGVYGAEWYNNLPVLTEPAAEHNATLPFTRNVVGSMDYTPCTFSDSQHKHITTNAHELALPVLFESALLHWADRPESYLAQPAEVQQLISTLPTVWDETRLLGGYPGKYVAMARRSGDRWYVAAINGLDEPQNVALNLDEIGLQAHSAQIFADGMAGEPWSISVDAAPDTARLQPRGGLVLFFK